MWGRPEEERGQSGRHRRVGSGDPEAGAEGGKGPGRRWGRDQARWRWRGLRRGGRGSRARDTPSRSPGGAASAPAALEAAAATGLAGRVRRGELDASPPGPSAARPAGAGGTPGRQGVPAASAAP